MEQSIESTRGACSGGVDPRKNNGLPAVQTHTQLQLMAGHSEIEFHNGEELTMHQTTQLRPQPVNYSRTSTAHGSAGSTKSTLAECGCETRGPKHSPA